MTPLVMHVPQVVPDRAPEATDAEAIAGVLAGDRQLFAVLVRRHNQVLFRTCRAILRNDQDAEDAVQSAWLSAYRALGRFRADSSFRTWVTRIAINEATTRLRQQKKLTAVPAQEIIMSERPTESPADHAFTKELASILARELDGLPDGLRSVLVLRDVIELDTAETAGCLGIEEENVRVRLHRARHTLAARLGASMEEMVQLALPELWRFDGDRCARLLDRVMAELDRD